MSNQHDHQATDGPDGQAAEQMTVLVTGATGFIGSHVAKALQNAGHAVRAFVRNPTKLESVTARVGVDISAITEARGDITDAAAVAAAVAGCDAVVHAAAVVGTDPTTEAEIEATNLVGAINVLGAAADAGCDPIVHISTASALFPFTADPVTADHPVGTARSAYARTKAACEQLARSYQARGKPVVIIYPAMVAGPDDYGGSTQIDPTKLWLTKPYPLSKGYTLSVVDVRDVAAVIAAAMSPGRGPKRYLMFGRHLNSEDHLAVLRDATGRDLKSVSVPRVAFWIWGKLGDLTRRVGLDIVLTSEAYEYMFNYCAGDDSFTRADTSVSMRPLIDTYRDTIAWMHRVGHLTADQAGTLA